MGETTDDTVDTTSAPSDPRASRDGEGRGGLTRRQFAVGAGATLFLPVAARLSPLRGGGSPEPPGAPGDGRPDGAQEAEEEPPGTEALVRYVEARWGDRLSEEEREEIRASIVGNLQAASALREVPLENGDGPASVFRPFRA